MSALNTRYKVHPDAFSTETDNQVVILQYTTGTYFTLNEVGTRIWQLLEEGNHSLQEIVTVLSTEYAASEAQLQRDVLTLAEQLKAKELLV